MSDDYSCKSCLNSRRATWGEWRCTTTNTTITDVTAPCVNYRHFFETYLEEINTVMKMK